MLSNNNIGMSYEDANRLIDLKLYHEIHVSEIREFQKCKWAWDWKYNQKYYTRNSAKPLEFGTMMHAGMEAYYDPQGTVAGSLDRAEAAIASTLSEQMNNALIGAFDADEVIREYQDRLVLGLGMFQYYAETIEPNEPQFKPLAVETNFVVPIPNAGIANSVISCKCERCAEKIAAHGGNEGPFLPVVLEGTIDLVLQYDNGKVWVRDWKNVARFSESLEWLDLDLQLNLYLWALDQLGYDIGGFEYFEQKKQVPELPEMMKRTSQGRSFSTSKDKPYEYNTYLAVIEEEDGAAYEAGLYDNYLDWLKNEGPMFYRFTRVRKNPRSLDALTPMLADIAENLLSDLGSSLYPTPTKFGCSFCEFRQPCMERFNGLDYDDIMNAQFEKREKHYYENRGN